MSKIVINAYVDSYESSVEFLKRYYYFSKDQQIKNKQTRKRLIINVSVSLMLFVLLICTANVIGKFTDNIVLQGVALGVGSYFLAYIGIPSIVAFFTKNYVISIYRDVPSSVNDFLVKTLGNYVYLYKNINKNNLSKIIFVPSEKSEKGQGYDIIFGFCDTDNCFNYLKFSEYQIEYSDSENNEREIAINIYSNHITITLPLNTTLNKGVYQELDFYCIAGNPSFSEEIEGL